jgi:MFS family permease
LPNRLFAGKDRHANKGQGVAQAIHRNADFMKLWAAQAISAIGARITRTVLPIIAILLIDATPTEVAILAALSFAPSVVVGLFAGGIVDRRAKRPLMIGADIFRAVVIVSIPLAANSGFLSMWQIYLVAGLTGAASSLFEIADKTFLPSVLPAEQLVDGNARLEASDAVAEGIGPWIGGALVGLVGAPTALVFDAVSYLWSALMLGFVRKEETVEPQGQEHGRSDIFADARTGVRASVAQPMIARILAATIVLSLSDGFFMALYMVVTVDILALSPTTVGAIIGVGGLGGVLGAMSAPAMRRRFGAYRAMVCSIAVATVFNFSVPLSLLFPPAAVPLLVSAQLVGDEFMTVAFIMVVSLRQEIMGREVLGRVNATFHLTESGALVAGSVLAAVLVIWSPVAWVIWGAAIGGVVALPVLLSYRPGSEEAR